jgi:hypothetical protein
MGLGLNRTDLNNTGTSYRNGTPVTLPLDVGNDVGWQTPDPTHFGNPILTSGTEQNVVNWPTPDPTHFGNNVSIEPTLSTPSFTPAGGTYTGTQSVTLTLDPSAQETYYTTDGTTPSPTNGTLYTTAISVSSSETIKAISLASGYISSAVGSASYTINSGSGVALVSHAAALNNGSFAGTITTSPIDTTGANFLIVSVFTFGTASRTVSDSYGNLWQALATGSGGDFFAQLFYSYAPTVGPGHTFTAAASGNDVSIAVAAFSGLNNTSSVYEAGSLVNSAYGDLSQAGDITPESAGDLIINGVGWFAIPEESVVSINEGFVALDTNIFDSYSSTNIAYLITSNTDTVNPTWVMSGSANGNLTGAAFAAA